MSGADWLREQARVCHELAVARGKYGPGWTTSKGRDQVAEELAEWHYYAGFNNGRVLAQEEYGDLLHVVLSLGEQMDYDVAKALADAQERNRRRVGEADQSGFCRSCGRPITDDGAYIKCFPCRVKDQGEGA